MKLVFIITLLLGISRTVLGHSNKCSQELSKYNTCLSAVDQTLLTSGKMEDIQSLCQNLKSPDCRPFLEDINKTTSDCDVQEKEEHNDALSILNLRIGYLEYCAEDSEGHTCPISNHLLKDLGEEEEEEDHNDHSSHDHSKEVTTFKNEEVKDRSISDWEGEWKSAYPLLLSGQLDQAFVDKAKNTGKMTAEGYKDYYSKGYKTDITAIVIKGKNVQFTYDNGKTVSSDYDYLGPFIVDWSSGTRAALYQFKAKNETSGAPIYIEFNDHKIEPDKASHFHLRSSFTSFDEIDLENNWPTFFPKESSVEEISVEISGVENTKASEPSHDEENDHVQEFYHDLMEDCKITECNQRFQNLLELLKLTSPTEAKNFEKYVNHYKNKNCDALANLLDEKNGAISSFFNRVSSLIITIVLTFAIII